MLEYLFNKVISRQASKIFKNIYFELYLQTAAFVLRLNDLDIYNLHLTVLFIFLNLWHS